MAGLMTVSNSSISTRTRKWDILTSSAGWKIEGSSPSTGTSIIRGSQETTSEGHRWPPRKGESFQDLGGPFITRKVETRNISSFDFHSDGEYLPGSYEYAYIKNAIPNGSYSSSTHLPLTLSTELSAEGTVALNQMRPTAPVSGFGVTVGELRKEIPALVGAGLKDLLSDHRKRRRYLKTGSEEYLNWEFGWMPLVRDLQDAAKAVIRSNQIINQLYRDSGRDVRRRFAFPVSKDVSTTSVTGSYPLQPGVGYLWGASGRLYTTTENIRAVWVSGMCRYYVPEVKDLQSRIQKQAMVANRLLGLRPDPELLWELAPWSWLADWVSDSGALVGNLSSYAFDGLVWKYAYLAEHQIERKRYQLVGHRLADGSSPRCAATRVRESKRRISATPFGFGLSLDSFSPYQWSILAALGLSRGNL